MARKAQELGLADSGQRILLPAKTRATHMQVIGASGRGKSKFLEGMIRRDILNGEGLCLIDPHGYLYHDLIRWCETKGLGARRNIQLFDPTAEGWSFGFNPLHFGVSSDSEISYAVDCMVRACAQVWGGEDTSRTPLLKRCLRSIFHALAEHRLTLFEALDLLSFEEEAVRRYLTEQVKDVVIRAQWEDFNDMKGSEFRETFASTMNRLLEFLAAGLVRTIVGQRDSVLDFARIMDEGGIVLVNLAASGKLSDDNARLLGTLLVNDLFLKARRRAEASRPFYLYIDECSLYINEDIGRILDEGRKFGLHAILAHQHLSQLKEAGEKVYSAVMTNAQTKVIFGGLTPEDARVLAEMIFLERPDFEEPKHILDKPTVVRYIKSWLKNYSESHGGGSGTAQTEAHSESVTDDEEATTTTSIGTTTSVTESESWSLSQGASEALIPELELMATQVYSPEEQIYRAMASMVGQEMRQALVKIPGRQTTLVKTPLVKPGVARDERVERFKQEAFVRSAFSLPRTRAEEAIESRHSRLRDEARKYLRREEPVEYLE